MRSLLLQLFSVACFFGILFTTGERPESFTPFAKSTKAVEEKETVAIPVVFKEKKVVERVEPPVQLTPEEISTPIPESQVINAQLAPVNPAPVANSSNNQFRITAETSLREFPAPEALVLRRIGEGESVEILEKSERFWWKVNYGGKIGWVKRHLLIPA